MLLLTYKYDASTPTLTFYSSQVLWGVNILEEYYCVKGVLIIYYRYFFLHIRSVIVKPNLLLVNYFVIALSPFSYGLRQEGGYFIFILNHLVTKEKMDNSNDDIHNIFITGGGLRSEKKS